MKDWNYKPIWDESFSQLKTELGEEEFNMWFNKLDYRHSGETDIHAFAPSDFFLKMFNPKYLPMLERKIEELAGKNLRIIIEPQKNGTLNKADTSQPVLPVKNKAHEGGKSGATGGTSRSSSSNPEGEKNKINPQLQEEYNFETYVVGEDNIFAFNAASAVARNPGTSSIYNPLLIYGGTGLGKTHLMQSIGNFIYKNSDLKILYITGEGFLHEYVQVVGLGQKNKEGFAKKYRNVDALLIDDIHTIERGAGTQDELFYTFEALINKKKQMVFTCDRPIAELKGMVPRLKSRFQKGLNVELKLPKFEELIAILHKKMDSKRVELKKNIVISDEILELIVKNISSNVRDMESALNKLMGYAALVDKPVTMKIAQRELKDIFSDPKQGSMSPDIITRIVAENFNLSPNDLKGKSRKSGIMKPRHIAIFLCRELTDYSSTEIGEAFGGRDHATVLHSHRIIQETSRADSGLDSTLERLKRMIKEYNVK